LVLNLGIRADFKLIGTGARMSCRVRTQLVWRRLEACGTNAGKYKLMTDDFKIGILCRSMGDTYINARWRINYPVTAEATDMATRGTWCRV